MIGAPSIVAPRLRRLRDLGLHLSIDDFGVGFTAIAYRVDFPAEEIDRFLTERDVFTLPDRTAV
jgi:sensor c-di-GMP phosphodiesterase-like protein